MKQNYFLLLLFLGTILQGCRISTDENPIHIVWQMGKNQVEPGCFDCTFYLVNNGKSALRNNWTIYFNQLPAVVKSEPSAGICIEHIAATYYKMYPTKEYVPLASGDTLAIRYIFKRSITRTSHAPEGYYIVWTDKEGNEKKIQDVPYHILPFDNAAQWSRPGAAELPYSSGERVYEANQRFETAPELKPTDVLPSLKEVKEGVGSFTFYNEVNITYDASLKQEADILKAKLGELGCTFAETATLTINLSVKHLSDAKNNEQYTLDLRGRTVEIKGESPHAVFNGVQTLLAIMGTNTLPYTMNSVSISDYPDLSYRGFMLDVARNFTTKEHLLNLIDVLSAYKINVLHLHLTDDEGWRIEIPGLEELTTVGAVRGHTTDEKHCLFPAYGGGWDASNKCSTANGHYSRADFIEILRYAKQCHMKVIPEVDLPGHARAAIKAMNARYDCYAGSDIAKAEEYLLTDFDDKSTYLSVQFFTDNTINVALPSVYRFVRKVVDEITAMYEEAGLKLDVFHFGGDEVPHGAWTGSEVCKAFMEQHQMTDIRELKDYFIEQLIGILAEKGMQLGAWQEVTLLPDKSTNPKFAGQNVMSYCWNIVPDWGSDGVPYHLANSGYPIILSNASNFYFDMSYEKHEDEPGHSWAGFVNEYTSFNLLPYQIYYSIRNNLSGKPIDIVAESKRKEPLKPAAKANIKGVQGQLWSETIRNYDMVQYYLFPKIFGLVERAWNVNPAWSSNPTGEEYEAELVKYSAKIGEREFKRLADKEVHFRLSMPGIKIENGLLLMNHPVKEATIYYTTDGSIPNEHSMIWTSPVPCDASRIRAKAYYQGEWSVATRYKE